MRAALAAMKSLPGFLCAILALLPLTLSALTTSIKDHGALADGKTMNTAAVQAAVDACAAAGGGTVVVPTGEWLTGTFELKSRVTLRLEAGAVLKASSSLEDYPPINYLHPELGAVRALIWAIGGSDIAIAGEGIIELADKPFFDWTRLRTGLKPEQDSLLQDWQRQQCVVPAKERPNQPLFFHDCRRLRVEGVIVRNSPCWTLVFSRCDGIQVRGVRMENHLQLPNNDGVHFTGSKNIVVSDCIISGGDDSLAFTGITDPASVSENIVVTNCVLTSRSAGIRIGYNAAKVRDITISNVVFKDCQRGIIIQASDNGFVENVTLTNLIIETKMFAGAWWGKGEPLVITAADSDSARIRNIAISHVRARSENSIVIVGQKRNISDITIEDYSGEYAYSANTPLYGQTLDLSPAAGRPSLLSATRIPWLNASSVAGLRLRDTRFDQQERQKQTLDLSAALHDVEP